eukprot:CAMPEP_0116844548 /NCGR_PEP_ID=MMETSP0418-20121206/12758_1 /TAXON_ID=1158023 /ORGANISM="Astrosyne radiata, Strain 13vi08-1A" /LENGTH=152 /DNA_ID=CAMNT_0004475531 /DNA_START=138 /DNA_END=596 /DNA_ORIENTATION=-
MHQRRNRSQPGSGNGHYFNNGSGGGSSNNMYRNNGLGNMESGRGGGLGASDTNANILEQQNNERIDELSSQVSKLKGLTIAIGNEVGEQNRLLDDMGDSFASTRNLLTGSLRKIGTMLESGGAKHMCYMVTFVVVVLVFLYWLMSYKGTSGA